MREEQLEELYQNKVIPLLQENLALLEEEYLAKREQWKEELLQFLNEHILQELQKLTAEGKSPAYLHFHMLRTRLLVKDYRYAVNVYEEEWYQKPEIRIENWNTEFIFTFFDKLWNQLNQEAKKLHVNVGEADVEAIMMRTASSYNAYVVKLLRFCRDAILKSAFYQELKKEKVFFLLCGEYFDFCEFIYKEIANRDVEAITEMILGRTHEETYGFGDFRGITIEDETLEQYTFPYTNFSHANMRNTRFLECDFTGAVFQETKFQNVRFERCNLSEAIFFQADFEEIDFIGSYLDEAVFQKEQVERLRIDSSLKEMQIRGLFIRD